MPLCRFQIADGEPDVAKPRAPLTGIMTSLSLSTHIRRMAGAFGAIFQAAGALRNKNL